NFPILNVLEAVGLLSLCTLIEPHFPHLIQIFYNNLLPDTDEDELSFSTYVKGTDFHVDADFISQIIGCPNSGVDDFNLDNFDRQLATTTIFGEGNIWQGRTYTASDLTFQNRLLHWVVNHIINPRTGSLGFFNEYHLFFLYHILVGNPINIP